MVSHLRRAHDLARLEERRAALTSALRRAELDGAPPTVRERLGQALTAVGAALDGAADLHEAERATTVALAELAAWRPPPRPGPWWRLFPW